MDEVSNWLFIVGGMSLIGGRGERDNLLYKVNCFIIIITYRTYGN